MSTSNIFIASLNRHLLTCKLRQETSEWAVDERVVKNDFNEKIGSIIKTAKRTSFPKTLTRARVSSSYFRSKH